jgi:hypothetical protein
VLFLGQLIFWTWLSERLKGNTRFFIVLVSQIWMLPLVLALELLPAKASPWVWYSVTILLVGYPYIHAILGASSLLRVCRVWSGRVTDMCRQSQLPRAMPAPSAPAQSAVRCTTCVCKLATSSRPTYVPPPFPLCPSPTLVYLIPSFFFPQPLTRQDTHPPPFQIYNAPDAPLYRTGNKVLLGLVAWNFVLIISIRYYYKWRNSQRDKVWNSLVQEERDNYLATTKDQGSKRLDFRFAY